jgi:hypothetical protein
LSSRLKVRVNEYDPEGVRLESTPIFNWEPGVRVIQDGLPLIVTV